MLFNSYEFILLFLPVTFLVFFAIARLGREAAIAWLVVASLFFLRLVESVLPDSDFTLHDSQLWFRRVHKPGT
jgi:ABC-type methionine transport system permease subunit